MSTRSVGRATWPLLLAVFIAGCASTGVPAAPVRDAAVCAQIFSTNDTHGRLLPAVQSWSEGRLVGGSAAMAGYANRARAANPDCPLFIASGGDIMAGTLISRLTDGRSTIEAMNAIGYDVVSIGNHEFDWGVQTLVDRIADAEFALLGANIYLKGSNRHPDWVRPWTIVEKDGVRVGFVGMTTLSTPVTTKPVNVVDYEFRSISETLDYYIPQVRAQGVDFVVAVMHEGGFCNDGSCEGQALDALAATTARFDYAVTGHTHSRLAAEIHGVPVVQSFSNSTGFGLGRIERAADGSVTSELIGIVQTYVDQVEPDADVAAIVEGYRAEQASQVDRVVTRLPEPLRKPRRGDFELGRIIADAQRHATGADVALMNNGGIRIPLPAGDVTYATLFELQPFTNLLVRVTISGAALFEALDFSIKGDGLDLQASGIEVTYDPTAPRGSRILGARLSDGRTILPDASYVVTVNDFMAMAGGGYTMFETGPQDHTGIEDLEALVDYLENLPDPMPIPTERRWIVSTPETSR